MTVALVLRSGGVYTPLWVQRLAAQIRAHHDVRVVCLSDVDVPGVETIRLLHDWPGWWAKVELFRPGLFDGPVLYFDLDTVILGPFDDLLAYDGRMAMLSDFYRPALAASGVMAWTPNVSTDGIYKRISSNDMQALRADDRWYRLRMPNVDRIQDLYPGLCVSWKVCGGQVPVDARILCFHGNPKQHNVGGWVQQLWEGAA